VLLASAGGCGHRYTRRDAADSAIAALGLMLGAIASAAASEAGQACNADRCIEEAPEAYRPPRKPRPQWTPAPGPAFRPRWNAMRPRPPVASKPDLRLARTTLTLPPSLRGGRAVEISPTGKTGWVKRCGATHFLIYDCGFDRPACFFYTDEREVHACEEQPCYAHEPEALTTWCEQAARTDGGAVSDWVLRQPR